MSHRLKILLFTEWYVPGFKAGGPIQSCKNLINTLSEEYDFYVFTSDRDLKDTAPYSGIPTGKWLTSSNGTKIRYSPKASVNSKELKQIFMEIEPDVVYLNSMFSLKYTILPVQVLGKINFSGRIILAPRGMLHQGAMQQKNLKKKLFLYLLSLTGMMKNISFHSTDEQEKKDIEKNFKVQKGVKIVSNVPNADERTWSERHKIAGSLKCIFVSRIHPQKNLLFALNAMNDIGRNCKIEFDVFGVNDDLVYFNECKLLAGSLGDNVKVNFKGAVRPDELFDVLRDHHLFILPTLGENFGHVVFEALSAGCPVLISDQTPWKDLEEHHVGWSLPLTAPQGFAKRIAEVCEMNADTFNKMSLRARIYARKYLASINFKEQYAKLFE